MTVDSSQKAPERHRSDPHLSPTLDSEFLVTRELAELLRTAESTVRYWRHTRTGPPSIKVGRRVLYRREAVLTWLVDRERADGGASESPPAVGATPVAFPRRPPSTLGGLPSSSAQTRR